VQSGCKKEKPMPVLTEINGNKVDIVFKGTYHLCQLERDKRKKTNPRTKYEVRSSEEAVKHKPILKA
jgi:hypothetical protein